MISDCFPKERGILKAHRTCCDCRADVFPVTTHTRVLLHSGPFFLDILSQLLFGYWCANEGNMNTKWLINNFSLHITRCDWMKIIDDFWHYSNHIGDVSRGFTQSTRLSGWLNMWCGNCGCDRECFFLEAHYVLSCVFMSRHLAAHGEVTIVNG